MARHPGPAWPISWSKKCSDTKDGNALQDLAANGASPNAFYSPPPLGYYFESTEKFEENLKILLSFVSVPWFTKEAWTKAGHHRAGESA